VLLPPSRCTEKASDAMLGIGFVGRGNMSMLFLLGASELLMTQTRLF
jgi:hypothetical protein